MLSNEGTEMLTQHLHAKRQVQTCHFKRDGLVRDINIYSYIYLEYIPILNIFDVLSKCICMNLPTVSQCIGQPWY